MKIEILDKNDRALLKLIQDLPKQQEFAQYKAVNETMGIAHKDLMIEVEREFDSPTKWFTRSTYVSYARRKQQDIEAFIAPKHGFGWMMSQKPEDIYMVHVFGGQRKDKRFEKLMKSRGLLPQGRNLIQARFGPRKNKYGNISAGMIQKILSGLQAQFDPINNSHKSSRSKGNYNRWAYTKINGVTGIWDVSGRKPKLYFYEAGNAVYKPRLKYFETIRSSVNTNFDMLHARWLRHALKTARV